ncbi:MAG: histidine phosphatase family protein [Thermoflexales bacterium]|nr:histidine phosphatase family protein [Thermoflexales bacterium]MDW8350784.1 histidine phosphatase family protein [Anaerolineae bacterium]
MKKLILVRHAKSSWDDPTLPDHDRPLNDRGLRDAPKMGERLAQRGILPDLILSSSAVRALTTAQLIAEKIGYDRAAIVVDRRIYGAQVSALLYLIQELDDAYRQVMLFGHNPELTELAHHFSKDIEDMPTCAIVELTFDVERWVEVIHSKPIEVRFDSPKKHA